MVEAENGANHCKALPLSDTEVAKALSDAGVDNTGKVIAVTLAWRGAYQCELDLAVEDPSGELTYYDNELSSTGGIHEADQYGQFEVNVENVSWNPTPLSGTYVIHLWAYSMCEQPDYTVYVNIDGILVHTFSRTLVDDDEYCCENIVGEFDYSAGSKKSQVKKYTGPTQTKPKNKRKSQ